MTSIYTEETKGQIKQTAKTFIAVIKTKQSPSRIRRGYLSTSTVDVEKPHDTTPGGNRDIPNPRFRLQGIFGFME